MQTLTVSEQPPCAVCMHYHLCACSRSLASAAVPLFGHVEIEQLVEHWTHDQKAASSGPGRIGGRIFFSRVNFVC